MFGFGNHKTPDSAPSELDQQETEAWARQIIDYCIEHELVITLNEEKGQIFLTTSPLLDERKMAKLREQFEYDEILDPKDPDTLRELSLLPDIEIVSNHQIE